MLDREPLYRFADFVLDPSERTLTDRGKPVPLQPKVLDALHFLCQHPGQLLPRQLLLDRLWPDCVVGDESLTQIIHKLRRALRDTSADPRFLQTLPRRGVRFLAAVEVLPPPPPEIPPPPARREPGDGAPPRAAPERSPETAPERPPETAPERPPETAPEAPPRAAPEHAPETAPERAPETAPEAPPRAAAPEGPAAADRPWRRRGLVSAALGLLLVGVGAAGLFGGRGGPEPPLAPGSATLRRLTHFIERDEDGSFSPDGKTVVFVSKHEGQGLFKLYAMRAEGGAPVRLTRSAAEETTPRFSPDGRLIAYTRHEPGAAHGDIWRVAPLGGDEAPLAPDATLSDWAPGGDALILVRLAPGGESQLVRAPLGGGGGAERILLRWPGWIDGLAVARAGDQLAFVSEQSLYLMPLGGGAPVRVDTGGSHIESVSFSPSGAELLFDSNRGGRGNLWRLPLPGGAPRPLTVGVGNDLYPSMSRGGALLFTGEVVRRVPYVVDRSGGQPRPLPVKTSYLSLAVSPAGDAIAVADYDDGLGADSTISVLSLPALTAQTLGPGRDPAFSPDGKRLAALADGALWEIDRGTGRRRSIAAVSGAGAAPAWSPDGRRLALSSAREAGLLLIDVESGARRRVLPGRYAGVAFSPDGAWLAACGAGAQGPGLYRIPVADPGAARRLTAQCSYEAAPIFDPDGGLRVLLSERTQPALVSLDAQGQERGRVVLSHPEDPRYWGIFEAHPLPEGWLYLLQLVEGDLYLMEPRPPAPLGADRLLPGAAGILALGERGGRAQGRRMAADK